MAHLINQVQLNGEQVKVIMFPMGEQLIDGGKLGMHRILMPLILGLHYQLRQ